MIDSLQINRSFSCCQILYLIPIEFLRIIQDALDKSHLGSIFEKCIVHGSISLEEVYSVLVIIKFIIWCRSLFVRQIKKSYRRQSTDEKYHIEPPMIKREL